MSNARTIALLAAALTFAAHNNSALAETRPCLSTEYERNAYIICEVDLRKHTLRLYWKRPDGTPYAYLSGLPLVMSRWFDIGKTPGGPECLPTSCRTHLL